METDPAEPAEPESRPSTSMMRDSLNRLLGDIIQPNTPHYRQTTISTICNRLNLEENTVISLKKKLKLQEDTVLRSRQEVDSFLAVILKDSEVTEHL